MFIPKISKIPKIPKIKGQELKELPKDLYIPPDAMQVILEIFEGPLDLLLYLIRKQNLNILDIKVANITQQYVEYIELMQYANLELTADYLEMAAILTEIKSKMLLPKINPEEPEEVDPRAALIKKLQEYEQIKTAAENLDLQPRQNRDFFVSKIKIDNLKLPVLLPEITLTELTNALKTALQQADLTNPHAISQESLSIRDAMSKILVTLQTFPDKFFVLSDFFNSKEGKLGIIVNFLAILELVKERSLEIMQNEPLAPIYIKTMIKAELEVC